MISVQEARHIITNITTNKKIVEKPLQEVFNYVLAETIVSRINMPPFRQSAMDGYGVISLDRTEFEVINEVKAGDSGEMNIQPHQAIKIFTGAKIPDTVQAIIQIEKCTRENDQLSIAEPAKLNQNIRPIGEQIKEGNIALEAGTILNPAAIGFLASLGIAKVKVYEKPSVGIVITGNELASPDEILSGGMVYESNGIMLQVAIKEYCSKCTIYQIKDSLEETTNCIQTALQHHDVVLISGGISVGDYDFVYEGLTQNEVEVLFYKVNQKPGKPLLFGKKENKYTFALPGNPAASLTCFYIYVLPLLKKYMGINGVDNQSQTVQIAHNFEVNNTRSQFLKAYYKNGYVNILTHQNSSMLNTFAQANCLLFLESGVYSIVKEDWVDIYSI